MHLLDVFYVFMCVTSFKESFTMHFDRSAKLGPRVAKQNAPSFQSRLDSRRSYLTKALASHEIVVNSNRNTYDMGWAPSES